MKENNIESGFNSKSTEGKIVKELFVHSVDCSDEGCDPDAGKQLCEGHRFEFTEKDIEKLKSNKLPDEPLRDGTWLENLTPRWILEQLRDVKE